MENETDIFDTLELIRTHPGMFFADHESAAQRIRLLVLLIAGYEKALERYAPEAPGNRFRERFSEYVHITRAWKSPGGVFDAILEQSDSDSEAMILLWKLINEFRQSTLGPPDA